MGLGNALGGIYGRVEGGFYGLMDALEQKGLPVYAVINPVEEHGIPAFPALLAMVVVVSALLYGLVFIGTSYDVSVQLILQDDLGAALYDVRVSAADAQGKPIELGGEEFSDGEVVVLKGMPIGSVVTFSANLQGYKDAQFTIGTEKRETQARLILESTAEEIMGRFRLVNEETGFDVGDAAVIAELADGSTRNCYQSAGDAGVWECPNVIEGSEVVLTIDADDFETALHTLEFHSGQVDEIELVPQAMFAAGDGDLIVRVYGPDGALVPEVRIQIYDAADNGLITDDVDSDGVYTEESLELGLSLRVVVSKTGYVTHDSDLAGDAIELADEETVYPVTLVSGGIDVKVSAVDAGTGIPVSSASVMLYNPNSALLASADTQFAGYVEFADLNASAGYIATANAQQYLPGRVEFLPLDGADVTMELERATGNNTGVLDIRVKDFEGMPANGAVLEFYELVAGRKLPLGLENETANLAGQASVVVPLNRNIKIEASKGAQFADANMMLKTPGTVPMEIKLAKKPGFVLLRLVDEFGLPVTAGSILIETKAGVELYDGEVTEGYVLFDSMFKNTVRLIYTDPDGRHYTEELSTGGKDVVEVVISEAVLGRMEPEIAFLGVYNANDEMVEGMVQGKDYFLKFETIWPTGEYRAGVHVRVGPDFIKNAAGQEMGIIGFEAVGAEYRYGRTYTALPEPGFEAIDVQNLGTGGGYNKWLELYFDEGSGKKVIKVRAKVKPGTETLDSFEVRYRAWAEIGNEVLRSPADAELGTALFSAERGALYAETDSVTVKVFESEPDCRDELCVSYKFIREDGGEFAADEFGAVQNERYALELEIKPQGMAIADVKASTPKENPKLGFMGYGVDSTAGFPDNNKSDTSIEATDLEIASGTGTRVRFYFKTHELGDTAISTQVVTALTAVGTTFNFQVYVERRITVRTEPEFLTMGEDFSIVVEDEHGNQVTDAVVKLSSSAGERLKTIIGNGSRGRGLNGVYSVENSFDAGTVKLEVSGERMKPYLGELEIASTGILKLPDSASLYMAKGETAKNASVTIENSGGYMVSEITHEIRHVGDFPDGLGLTAVLPKQIAQNAAQSILLKGAYTGSEDSAFGEAELIVHGRMLNRFPVKASMMVSIAYNQPLAAECLEFSKGALGVALIGNLGSRNESPGYAAQYYNAAQYDQYFPGSPYAGGAAMMTSGTAPSYSAYRREYSNSRTETAFTARNHCDVEIRLVPTVVAAGGEDDDLRIDVPEIVLGPAGQQNDSREVKVSITNTLFRDYPDKRTLRYDILFESPNISRAIPLDIMIWNSRFALQMNRNIEVWLTGGESGPGVGAGTMPMPNIPGAYSARATIPLLVRNIGETDIENITFSQVQRATSNIMLDVYPKTAAPVLRRGSALLPPPLLTVAATRTEKATMQDNVMLSVHGTIDGRSYEFGPVFVTAHISPAGCLAVLNTAPLEFTSTKTSGAQSQAITVRNSCAEPVRVMDIEPKKFGTTNNTLEIAMPVELMPGQEIELRVVLKKNEAVQHSTTAYLKAFMLASGRWTDSQHFRVDAKIGKYAEAKGAAAMSIEMQVCGKDETKLVNFPQVAAQANCDVAYCDAEQLAQYLAKRVADSVYEAKRHVANYRDDASKTNCGRESLGRGICMFDRLGVSTAPFYVYMMNDNMSTEMLKDAIKNSKDAKVKAISHYMVDYVSSAEDFAAGSRQDQVLLTGNFMGCGRYRVKINGSVRAEGNRLHKDLMGVVVEIIAPEAETESGEGSTANLATGREAGEGMAAGLAGGGKAPGAKLAGSATATAGAEFTEQCEAKIQNIMNFLPVDGGFETQQTCHGCWLGIATAEDEALGGLGAEFAETLFGKPARFVPGKRAINTNKVVLKRGVTEGYIVKVGIPKTTGAQPRAIEAIIRTVPAGNAEAQALVAKEAAKAIADVKSQSLGAGGDNCISENEDYLLIKSAREVGKITVEPCAGRLTVYENMENCCEFRALNDTEARPVNVMARHEIEAKGTGEPYIKRGGKTLGAEDAVELKAEKAGEGQQYSARLKLCVVGNEYAAEAHERKLVISAKDAGDALKKAEEQEVVMEYCGVNPGDVVERAMKELKPGEKGVVTLTWDGPQASVGWEQMRGHAVKKAAGLAEQAKEGATGVWDRFTSLRNPKQWKTLKGAGVFLGACMATAVPFTLIPGFGQVAGPKAAAFDCGLPFVWLASGAFEDVEAVGAVKDYLREIASDAVGLFGKAAEWTHLDKVLDWGGAKIAGEKPAADSLHREMLTMAFASVTPTAAYYGVKADDVLTSARISGLSSRVADDVTEQVLDRTLGTVPKHGTSGLVDDFRNAVNAKLGDSIKKSLEGHQRAPWRPWAKAVGTDDALQKAINTAVSGVMDDTAVKGAFDNLANTQGVFKLKPSILKELNKGSKQKIETELVDRIKNLAGSRTGWDSQSIDELVTTMRQTSIEGLQPDDFEAAIRRAFEQYPGGMDASNYPKFADDIAKELSPKAAAALGIPDETMTDEGMDALKKALGGAEDAAEGAAKYKTPKFWSSKGWKFAWSLGKGLGVGLLANLAGMKAYDWYMARTGEPDAEALGAAVELVAPELGSDKKEIKDGRDNDGDGLIDEPGSVADAVVGDIPLAKGQRLLVEKTKEGKIRFTLIENSEEVPAGAKKLDICDPEKLKKGLPEELVEK